MLEFLYRRKLKSGNPEVRVKAVLALQKSTNPRTIDALSHLLGDPDNPARWLAAMALSSTGNTKAVNVLMSCLEGNTCGALGLIKDPVGATREQLRLLLSSDALGAVTAVREALRTNWSSSYYAGFDSSEAKRIARRCAVAEDILKLADHFSWDDRLWSSLKCGSSEDGSNGSSQEWRWIAEQGARAASACIALLDQYPVVMLPSHTFLNSPSRPVPVMPLSRNQLHAMLAVFRKEKCSDAVGHVLRMLDLWIFGSLQMDGHQTSGTRNADLIRGALGVLRATGSLALAKDLLLRFLACIIDSSDAYLYEYRWVVDELSEIGGDDVVLALHSDLRSLELRGTENDRLYEGWASLVSRSAPLLKRETLEAISVMPRVHRFLDETDLESDQARHGTMVPIDTNDLQQLVQSELRRRRS